MNNDSQEDNSGKEIDEEDEEGERDDNRGKAYSALLTLLKSEHKEKPKNVTSGSSSQVEKPMHLILKMTALLVPMLKKKKRVK